MTRRKFPILTLTLDKIVGGGQAIGTCPDGRRAFVWGGLPGETVTIQVTRRKSNYVEGCVTSVLASSAERIAPLDPDSYLSTSPWQIMSLDSEQHYKSALIEEAFELHDIVLPDAIDLYTDGRATHYRNKVEFSWYGSVLAAADVSDTSTETAAQPKTRVAAETVRAIAEQSANTLDLAFFRRGSKGKVAIQDCSLLPEPMMRLARAVRDLLMSKHIEARQLKTLLIRSDQSGNCVWQLYLKDEIPDLISPAEAAALPAQGGEVIYSDPQSPASRITKRLAHYGEIVLTDTVLGVPFRYATEGFFQVNIPVYEQALTDMRSWIIDSQQAGERSTVSTLDLYSGVGSIGLTIGGENVTLVELNQDAVREMRRNITKLGREDSATAILAPSEKALEYITSDMIVIVDPPRAGLHADVVKRLLEATPPRIIYLSCNPVTQARDVALLAARYGIKAHRGYNFFPRTPHIEHLVILDLRPEHE